MSPRKSQQSALFFRSKRYLPRHPISCFPAPLGSKALSLNGSLDPQKFTFVNTIRPAKSDVESHKGQTSARRAQGTTVT
jgi:hypothetical protein